MRTTEKIISVRAFLLILLLLAGCKNIAAQGKYSVSGGWGYYELTNIGLQYNFTPLSSFSLIGGTNFGVNNKTCWSAGLSFYHQFEKYIVGRLRPGFSLSALYWTSDDDLYYFQNLAIPVMALVEYPVSSRLSFRLEAGVIANMILQSDRKQNVEAGFPERYNGNISLGVIYNFGSK